MRNAPASLTHTQHEWDRVYNELLGRTSGIKITPVTRQSNHSHIHMTDLRIKSKADLFHMHSSCGSQQVDLLSVKDIRVK